jgi:uncharacterized protein (DUF58 family)
MTLLLGFSAVNTGNNLIYFIVAALLAFMAVSGVAGWLNIRGLDVECCLPVEIYCNRPALTAITLTNKKPLIPSFLLEICTVETSILFPMVLSRTGECRNATLLFNLRGEHPLGPLKLSSRFPINFFVRYIAIPQSTVAIVFPEPMPGPLPQEEGQRYRGSALSSTAMGQGGEMKRIMDYTGVEPLRQIHWRLSARHGHLKVKEFEALSGPPLLLDLEAFSGGVEERLSRAAFLVNRLCRQGRTVGLRGAGVSVPPASGNLHRLRILRELARYGTV